LLSLIAPGPSAQAGRESARRATVPIPFFKQAIAVLAYGSDTNGVLGAIHQREDEAFYVVEGAYSVFIGDDVIEASPGTWVWGPRVWHTAIRSIRSSAGI
jgi:mannose-6-phosphate isomerase-like protein (cupin superfamily)